MQLGMHRGGCRGTNAFVMLLSPPQASGHSRCPGCPPRCMGAGEHPRVLLPPCIELVLPQEPPSPPGVSGAWRSGSFPGWGHGGWHRRFTALSPQGGSGASAHVPGIALGVLPSPSRVPTLGATQGCVVPWMGRVPWMVSPGEPLQTCLGGTVQSHCGHDGQ